SSTDNTRIMNTVGKRLASGQNESAPKDKRHKTIACDRCRRRKAMLTGFSSSYEKIFYTLFFDEKSFFYEKRSLSASVRCDGDGYNQVPCVYCTSVQLECTYNQSSRSNSRNVNSGAAQNSSKSDSANAKNQDQTTTNNASKSNNSTKQRTTNARRNNSVKSQTLVTASSSSNSFNPNESIQPKRIIPQSLPFLDTRNNEFYYAVQLLTEVTSQHKGAVLRELSPYISVPQEEKHPPPPQDSNENQWSELTESLVNLYFLNFHPLLPVLHKAYFMEGLKRHKPMNPLLLHAVCAIGSTYSNNPNVRKDPDDPRTVGQGYYEHAQALVTKNFDAPRLSTATGCFLLGIFDALRSLKSRMYVGMATTLAITMRFHDKNASKDLSQNEKEARIKLWWAINIVNHLTCVALNQRSIFEDKHSTIDLPADTQSTNRQDQIETHINTYFEYYSKISKILYDILEFTLNPESALDTATLELEERLRNWKDSLPTLLQIENAQPLTSSSDETTIEHLRIYLCILYHYAMIRIHYPNIYSKNSKDICSDAANRITTFTNEHLVFIINSNQFIAHCALYAGYIHLRNIIDEESNNLIMAKEAHAKALQTMIFFQKVEQVPSLHFISSAMKDVIAIFASQLRNHLTGDEHAMHIVNAVLANSGTSSPSASQINNNATGYIGSNFLKN
ncbi:8755_t:CDS:2, partial [Ambispora gerdemannii]